MNARLPPAQDDTWGASGPGCVRSPRRLWAPLALLAVVLAVAVSWWAAVAGGFVSTIPGYPLVPFWWPLGFFVFVAVFFLLVRAVWWGPGWYGRRWAWDRPRARDIAAERYARGELTREEFHRMIDDLDAKG